MRKIIMNVGLDVHKETIDVALAPSDSTEIRHYGTIGGDIGSLDRTLRKLESPDVELRIAYEAGPCGFNIVRYCLKRHIECLVVAPSRIPKRPGDKVKTDRRDASSLARLLRAAELRCIYIPTEEDEAIRDLSRARESAMINFARARKQLLLFLLRHGIVYTGKSPWHKEHLNFLARVVLPHSAQQIVYQESLHQIQELKSRLDRLTQQIEFHVDSWRWKPVVKSFMAFRGVQLIVAAGIVAELGDLSRFSHPKGLMNFLGLVPSEYSSGPHRLQGMITRTGNTHARRLLVEAAWAYVQGPKVSEIIRKRQVDLPQPIIDIAWNAQLRLCRKYRRLMHRGKNKKVAVVAVARELAAFMWNVHRHVVVRDRDMLALP